MTKASKPHASSHLEANKTVRICETSTSSATSVKLSFHAEQCPGMGLLEAAIVLFVGQNWSLRVTPHYLDTAGMLSMSYCSVNDVVQITTAASLKTLANLEDKLLTWSVALSIRVWSSEYTRPVTN